MTEYLEILERAARSLHSNDRDRPAAEEVVAALLEAEKVARKRRESHPFEGLCGTWRLYLITGTKKTRDRPGVLMGAGRYIPALVEIGLTYSPVADIKSGDREPFEAGRIENRVGVGLMTLTVGGPAKFLLKNDILAFDFTRMGVRGLGLKLYDGYIRNGKSSEETFYQKRVAELPFFAYFLIRDQFIAARGRGGGLALWVKA
ncbi:hypothetical protein [Lyngbya sp. CCY1209]|uniref:hypothetical protein n=1 Tax=Lyngbya sp. CCY1209 TaxID=2886103 RepID=UPI002D20EB5A|nr:hypothetical protein [Lyngbya sp. CCY1209]MEB3883937.1 hypothetical protein [Lyngbya sp. CCY1209]